MGKSKKLNSILAVAVGLSIWAMSQTTRGQDTDSGASLIVAYPTSGSQSDGSISVAGPTTAGPSDVATLVINASSGTQSDDGILIASALSGSQLSSGGLTAGSPGSIVLTGQGILETNAGIISLDPAGVSLISGTVSISQPVEGVVNLSSDLTATDPNDAPSENVPEPSTWALLATGLGSLFAARKMSRAQHVIHS